jgi:hypothetical protein
VKIPETNIPSWTEIIEREKIWELAKEVPFGGDILEIGALYGGTTSVLAMGAPVCNVTSVDEFSWTPPGYPATSAKLLQENLDKLGIKNVSIIEADSRNVGITWNTPLDLLWIDGGHSYEFVYADLVNFGPHAKVIALHDFDNPHWPDIRQAVEKFLSLNKEFSLTEVVGTVAVLRKK